ncbi:MAG: hypothetical protein PHP94_01210 [Eubacteriales bacterium]|nr:hypothetical protein [Eubacteriales bacterium]
MNLRQNTRAILHDEAYDYFPVVHFGYWDDTVRKWQAEGHLPTDLADPAGGRSAEQIVSQTLGFDFGWGDCAGGITGLLPPIETRVIETLPNGQIKSVDENGAIILTKPGITSIPSEVGHLLTDRASWEEHFLPRLQFSSARIPRPDLDRLRSTDDRATPLGINCGSLFGTIRNWLGLEGSAYLLIDDEPLFTEIIDTHAALQLQVLQSCLEQGARPDYAHFWEDICCKSGPLIHPDVFEEKVGPWYEKFTRLLLTYDIDIVSLDCDGVIDRLIPTWFSHGVNTMFPIEVGVWNASITPWRARYGPELRGVGGMNKNVFALDYAAIDQEIERLRRLTDAGGFIPCPDHRIPPTARWENVQYYCDRLRRELNR